MLIRIAALFIFANLRLGAQNGWFQPSLLEKPEMKKAMQSVDDRAAGIVDEWIRLVETPAPSGKEQARARYMRAEMEKLRLSEIRTDDIFNVSGVRKGTGGGPTVVFAAHMDTVFPEGTDLKVKREGDILRAPGVGDDTSNLMATLEMFRALDRGGIKTKGDLIFLASVQEELGLLGAKHWLEKSGYKPDMFVAVDLSSIQVWYGALRIDQFKFFYTSPGAHTMESRGGPSPAKAVAKKAAPKKAAAKKAAPKKKTALKKAAPAKKAPLKKAAPKKKVIPPAPAPAPAMPEMDMPAMVEPTTTSENGMPDSEG